jgi:hypothetical protein
MVWKQGDQSRCPGCYPSGLIGPNTFTLDDALAAMASVAAGH